MSDVASIPNERAVALGDGKAARSKSRGRIDYIEYFRGVAILLIVAGHAFDLAWTRSGNEHTLDSVSLLTVLSALLTGGTFYFVFISGFLYRHVFYERMSYGDFMRKKALQVGIPYLVLGGALAFPQMNISDFHVTIFKHGAELGENRFVDLVALLSTGNMMTAYWYIPFIFVVFLASPLFDQFIRLPQPAQIAVLIGSLLVAFWIHRPYESLNPIHSFIYFANIYLFGILFCEHRTGWMSVLTRPGVLVVLAVGLVCVAIIEDTVLHKVSDLERAAGDGWMPLGLDLMIPQKYLGILLCCGVLARWGDIAGRSLSYLAERSFGLYFIHGIVLTAINHAPVSLSPNTGNSVADFLLYALATIGLSLAVVIAAKRMLGGHSRYVVGC